MSKSDEPCTIDLSTLHTVTGGLASGGGANNDSDTKLQLALQSVKSSISDIGKNQQTTDPMAMMLPMIMMMKQRQG